MTRSGFGAIFLVMLAVVLLFIWAGAQHFVTSSVRRRVRVAEAERAATLQALSSAEQVAVFLPALLTLHFGAPAEGAAPEGVQQLVSEVGVGFSTWKPDEPVRVRIPLPWMSSSMKHIPVRLDSSEVVAHMIRVEGGPDAPFDPERDCERYASWLSEAEGEPGDPAFEAERERRFPGWQPVKVTGLGEIRTSSVAEGVGVRLRATAALLRQFEMSSSPCPEAEPDDPGFSFRVHPVELGRSVDVRRDARPSGKKASK